MEKRYFGTLDSGEVIHTYTLKNDIAELTVMDRGATVVGFCAYETDVVLGFDTLDGYVKDTSYQGVTVGRVANRIDGASFSMDGAFFMVTDNEGGNCLHGGNGFQYKRWELKTYTDNSLTFSYFSPDGEEGFPSDLLCEVSFTLVEASLIISYRATPFGKTPISLTNHSFFNLDGVGGDIKEQKIKIYADSYTAVNESLIPTGERPSVFGTEFDFTDFKKIGEHFGDGFEGYDHNFILKPKFYGEFLGTKLPLAAEVLSDRLMLSVYTDQPGVHFYSGGYLGDGPDFKGGMPQTRYGGFCLEAQIEPDSVNHGIGFYDAGDIYTQLTVYKIIKR